MSVTHADLASFHSFAHAKLENAEADSMSELFSLWLLENPSGEESAQTVAAIQAGLEDIKQGRVIGFEEANQSIREQFGWTRPE